MGACGRRPQKKKKKKKEKPAFHRPLNPLLSLSFLFLIAPGRAGGSTVLTTTGHNNCAGLIGLKHWMGVLVSLDLELDFGLFDRYPRLDFRRCKMIQVSNNGIAFPLIFLAVFTLAPPLLSGPGASIVDTTREVHPWNWSGTHQKGGSPRTPPGEGDRRSAIKGSNSSYAQISGASKRPVSSLMAA